MSILKWACDYRSFVHGRFQIDSFRTISVMEEHTTIHPNFHIYNISEITWKFAFYTIKSKER